MNISEFVRQEEERASSPARDLFGADLFTVRRSGAGVSNFGNPYDPESLITGAEVSVGFTYYDKREWPNQETYERAVAGQLPVNQIPAIAPRVRHKV